MKRENSGINPCAYDRSKSKSILLESFAVFLYTVTIAYTSIKVETGQLLTTKSNDISCINVVNQFLSIQP